jgi:hypothetical protein
MEVSEETYHQTELLNAFASCRDGAVAEALCDGEQAGEHCAQVASAG